MKTQLEVRAASIGQLGQERLGALAARVGFSLDEITAMQGLFGELLHPWAGDSSARPPAWPSDVSDDHSPFEFSIAIGGAQRELRVLVESRSDPPTLESNQVWGESINALLRRRYGVCLDRFAEVRDLFLPAHPDGVFAIWHAVSFWPGHLPEFKLYLNLSAQGLNRAPEVAREALQRLGFGSAWPEVVRHSMRRGPADDQLVYFSVDLAATPAARVKLYVRHHRADLAVLEESVQAPVGSFCRALAGSDGPYLGKGPVVCLGFVEGDGQRPSARTLYFPIAAYACDDRAARDRIVELLRANQLPVEDYLGPLEAFALRNLDEGVGMQSYVSIRQQDGRPRMTVYFSPELYHVQPPRPRLVSR
jgi:Tryptophan dimethylallyltransferase